MEVFGSVKASQSFWTPCMSDIKCELVREGLLTP